MDLELLRTFIEVCRCRHFGKAADRLYITQSAVSARIRQLENSLGCQLLIRERKQVQPTIDGERFLPHAENLLRQWARARREMTDSAAGGPPLRIGAIPVVWEVFGLGWLSRYHTLHSETRLQSESHSAVVLMPRMLEGALDLVLQFGAPRTADSEYRLVARMPLVLASSRAGDDFSAALKSGYVSVEWGSAFAAAQAEFTDSGDGTKTRLKTDDVRMALGWLSRHGGSAFLPEPLVKQTEGLHVVANAPVFEREVHANWPVHSERRDQVEQFLAVIDACKEGQA